MGQALKRRHANMDAIDINTHQRRQNLKKYKADENG